MTKIDKLRQQIDTLDVQLIELLSKRQKISHEIGIYKKKFGFAPLDKKRWHKLLSHRLALAKTKSLPTNFVEEIFSIIHKYSLLIQKQL